MSDSQATASNAAVSYADDFHSASLQSPSHSGAAPAYVESENPTQAADDDSPSGNFESERVWYQFHDGASRRSIRIYAPDFPVSLIDEDTAREDRSTGANKAERRRQSLRSRGSTLGGAAGDSAVSYSSNFDPENSEASKSSSSSSSSPSSLTLSSSSSTSVGSGASYLRVMSIDQLTTADDLYADEACERLTRRATLTALASMMPQQPPQCLPPLPTESSALQAKAVESKARFMVCKLRAAELLHFQDNSPLRNTRPSNPPYLQLAGVPENLKVSSLAVERLRVDTLRQGARLLVAAETHEPNRCPDCRRERERLATADWHRELTRQVRRDTIETRLRDHQPACIVSREMLNVAKTARLVSDWMRTGQVPEPRGFR